MKVPAICTWIGSALRRLYKATPSDDPLGAITRDAIARSEAIAEHARHVNDRANKAIADLLKMVEAEKHGRH